MKYKIGKSKIEGAGKGLLVKKAYREGEIIGLAHIDDQPATSIGKFHNHSEEPTAGSIQIDNRRYLVAMRDLEPGDEITTDYRQQPELEQPEDFKRGGSTKLPKMPKPSKKGVLAKGYSRSLEATNKLFTENKLFAKPKSKKRKVFDPGANYEEGGSLPQAEYGMPLGAGMSQNYQGRRKFIHQDGGMPKSNKRRFDEKYSKLMPKEEWAQYVLEQPEVVVKTPTKPKVDPTVQKLNALKKKLKHFDSQNDGKGPISISGMFERAKVFKEMVNLEAQNKEKLKNTPRLEQVESIGNTMLTVGKYFMPGPVKTGINYLLNASDAYDYVKDPNNESNKVSVTSDVLSPLKSPRTKLAPFSVVSDAVNLKQQYDKFKNAKNQNYQNGGEPGDKFKKRLMKRNPGMQGVYGPEGENLNIVKDPNYDARSVGYGDIEFMAPGLEQVNYENRIDKTLPGYTYVNPSPDKYTSIYNPRGANRADIFLDMMHGMRDDQNYEPLLQNFDKAVRDARGGDMQYYYEKDVAKGYTDSQEQWNQNYVDGQLRAQLAPGTLGMFSHGRRDYRKERRHDSPEMRQAGKDIKSYLKTPKEEYIETELTPEEIEEYRRGGWIVEEY
jgi:hypothetical protein